MSDRHPHQDLADLVEKAYKNKLCIRLAHGVEVAPFREQNLLVVQGSDLDPRDWFRNALAFRSNRLSSGPAPWGFARGAERILRWLREGKTLHLDPQRPLTVSGHSAGSAMGHLVAEELARQGWMVKEFVGLAPPRTGKRELLVPATLYDHGGDLVCKLPWWWPHPCELVTIPDVTDLPLQHSLDHYRESMALHFQGYTLLRKQEKKGAGDA